MKIEKYEIWVFLVIFISYGQILLGYTQYGFFTLGGLVCILLMAIFDVLLNILKNINR